jgi:hypothetical protein
LIHFDFDDRYQDEAVVGSAVSGGSRALLSGVFHTAIILLLLFGGRLLNLIGPSPEELERGVRNWRSAARAGTEASGDSCSCSPASTCRRPSRRHAPS